MGKTGPKPKREDGFHLTRAGYLRGKLGGRLRLVHDWVWEQENGPIPAGYCIHHRDEDRANNDLANLELVSHTDHKRLHGNCELRSGVWWKQCTICGEYKPITTEHWYFQRDGYPGHGRCRPCHIRRVVHEKRLRKMRRKGQAE